MKDYIMTIQELLKGRNEEFDASTKVKLVRHTWSRKEDLDVWGKKYNGSLRDMYRYNRDLFLEWQSGQSESKFKDVEYVVVFIGEYSTTSRFIGVFKNTGHDSTQVDSGDGIKFFFEEIPGFELLKDRAVIDWGKATTSWMQDYQYQKNVLCIDSSSPYDNSMPKFVSYNDVCLNFDELARIIATEDKEWKSKLTAVNCVYMIQDRKNGKQYVGSTYGNGNIWGRWSVYVKTNGHGDNVKLKEIIDKEPNYAHENFQWIILETLDCTIQPEDAITRENLYKKKFMTREHGYNMN